jgi:Outer membrane protein beta-barrel domain
MGADPATPDTTTAMPMTPRLLACTALAISAAGATGTALAGDGPVSLMFNGGYAAAIGTTSDYLKAGWNLGTGVMVMPDTAGQLAMQFDLGYTNFNATSNLIQAGQAQNFRINSGNADIWSLTAAGKFMTDTDTVRGYGLLGLGIYKRHVALTETAYGTGWICDPWWGWCYPGLVSGNLVVASRTNTKLGYNVGIGVEFLLESDSAWFIEARFHWIDGTHPTEYMPIQIGFRF